MAASNPVIPLLSAALLCLSACAAGSMESVSNPPSDVGVLPGATVGTPAGTAGTPTPTRGPAPTGAGTTPVPTGSADPATGDELGTQDDLLGVAGMGGSLGDGLDDALPPTGGGLLDGACCSDGDCLCHGPDPSALTASNGPYNVDSYVLPVGKVFYPTDAEPPFAAIAICPGFINSGPEMEPWGPFYASHGFVMIATNTLGTDIPDIRATKLLAAIDALDAEHANSASPLFEKLSGRYGTSGYSMGGGGTTIASGRDSSLMTSIGLAAWGPVTTGVSVPTLLLCGTSDGTAPCSMSSGAYASLPDTTPKMMISISGASHFNWFSPTAAGSGVSGKYALAFQKVYLAGDERWRPLLTQSPSGGTQTTNIQ